MKKHKGDSLLTNLAVAAGATDAVVIRYRVEKSTDTKEVGNYCIELRRKGFCQGLQFPEKVKDQFHLDAATVQFLVASSEFAKAVKRWR